MCIFATQYSLNFLQHHAKLVSKIRIVILYLFIAYIIKNPIVTFVIYAFRILA